MPARVQLVREAHELFGTGGDAVKKHHGNRTKFAMQQQLGTPGIGNPAVVAAPESFEQGSGSVG